MPGPGPTIDWKPLAALGARGLETEPNLLLAIVTRTSHFCHVLDREAWDEPEVARAAARFVCVRVDADQRPDLDARFQPHALFGWPLVCLRDAAGWRAAVCRSRPALLDLLSGAAGPAPAPAPVLDLLLHLRQSLRPFGGFSAPPLYPHPPLLELLLELDQPWALGAALRTLDGMAQGGLHDQLGGGFHRHATDERWVVPHFEKRAADQAGLLRAYLCAFERVHPRAGDARHAEVARGIVGYAERRLADPAGGFYLGEDADAFAYDDGGYYTFSVDEARAALDPDEFAVAQCAYDIFGRGELHSDPTRNVLFVAAAPDQIALEIGRSESEVRGLLSRARQRLLEARLARMAPPVDQTLCVDVSADLARAFCQADRTLGLPAARAQAVRTFERLRETDRRSFWPADAAQLGLLAHALGDQAAARALAGEAASHIPDPAALARDGAAASPTALTARLFVLLGDPEAAQRLLAPALREAARLGVSAAGLLAADQLSRRTCPPNFL